MSNNRNDYTIYISHNNYLLLFPWYGSFLFADRYHRRLVGGVFYLFFKLGLGAEE